MGSWQTLAIGDLDGDGRDDLASNFPESGRPDQAALTPAAWTSDAINVAARLAWSAVNREQTKPERVAANAARPAPSRRRADKRRCDSPLAPSLTWRPVALICIGRITGPTRGHPEKTWSGVLALAVLAPAGRYGSQSIVRYRAAPPRMPGCRLRRALTGPPTVYTLGLYHPETP